MTAVKLGGWDVSRGREFVVNDDDYDDDATPCAGL